MCRRDFGNTPNTSKSLRLLISSRMVARAGQGGRVDAFRYSIPGSVLAVIAPGGIGAHQGAAAACPPVAGMDGTARQSGAAWEPGCSAVVMLGAQAARCGGLATPAAPAEPSPAQARIRLPRSAVDSCTSCSCPHRTYGLVCSRADVLAFWEGRSYSVSTS